MATSPAKRIETQQKRARMLAMRLAGVSYQQIADEVGYKNGSVVSSMIGKMLKDHVKANSMSLENMRQLELEHLESLRVVACEIMERFHLTITPSGKIIALDGVPVEDDGPKLAAIDRLIKIHEKIARLLGIEAPERVQSEIQVNYTFGGVDISKL
jgi:hypothetical protein